MIVVTMRRTKTEKAEENISGTFGRRHIVLLINGRTILYVYIKKHHCWPKLVLDWLKNGRDREQDLQIRNMLHIWRTKEKNVKEKLGYRVYLASKNTTGLIHQKALAGHWRTLSCIISTTTDGGICFLRLFYNYLFQHLGIREFGMRKKRSFIVLFDI